MESCTIHAWSSTVVIVFDYGMQGMVVVLCTHTHTKLQQVHSTHSRQFHTQTYLSEEVAPTGSHHVHIDPYPYLAVTVTPTRSHHIHTSLTLFQLQ